MSEIPPGADELPRVWGPCLETGVAALDLQHRVLFDLLMRAREAASLDLPVDLGPMLQQLRSYADYHFRYEEDWLRQHLPLHVDGASHVRQHAGFLNRLAQLEDRLQRGTLELPALLDFLSQWLTDHIVRQDVPLIRPLARAAAGRSQAG